MHNHPQSEPHPHNGHKHAGTAVKEYEVVAQFPSDTQARRAEQVIHDHAKSTTVQPIESHKGEAEQAEMGVSAVEIGMLAWIGLVVGIVIGAVLGWLVFAGTITLPGIAPALGAGVSAIIFLGAGILGSVGWLTGALIHLLRNSTVFPQRELRAVVEEDQWQQVGESLVDAGAVNVLVPNSAHDHDEQHHDEPHRQDEPQLQDEYHQGEANEH